MFSSCGLTRGRDRDRPFSRGWWLSLVLTGVALGCTLSVKFVGLFVVVLVGVSTVGDLWDLLGDWSIPVARVGRHFAARACGLIVVPVVVYLAIFAVHLSLLSNWGRAANGFVSPEFQVRRLGVERAASDTACLLLRALFCICICICRRRCKGPGSFPSRRLRRRRLALGRP